jgi:hypothetical protein
LSEKISRVKLRDHGATGIGTFEALEFLLLGIHGKLALWRALAVVARTDARFADFDLEHLAGRAKTQEAAVDALRLQIAPQQRLAARKNYHRANTIDFIRDAFRENLQVDGEVLSDECSETTKQPT